MAYGAKHYITSAFYGCKNDIFPMKVGRAGPRDVVAGGTERLRLEPSGESREGGG